MYDTYTGWTPTDNTNRLETDARHAANRYEAMLRFFEEHKTSGFYKTHPDLETLDLEYIDELREDMTEAAKLAGAVEVSLSYSVLVEMQ